MFNLLIFFLVATSFKLPEALLTARVPKTTGIAASIAVPLVPITIYLQPSTGDQALIIRVSSSIRSDAASLTVLEDFIELADHLKSLKARGVVNESTPVVIAARNATPWDHVVDAYNASVVAQFKQIVFAGWE